MWRTASAVPQLSMPSLPIKFNIAARLFRSIAFLLLGVGSTVLSAAPPTSQPQPTPMSPGSPIPATIPPLPTPAPVSIVYRAFNLDAIHDYRADPDVVRLMVK